LSMAAGAGRDDNVVPFPGARSDRGFVGTVSPKALCCLLVLSAFCRMLLARGGIVTTGEIAQSAIADIEPLNNSEAKRP
jgi:hypothetical protein